MYRNRSNRCVSSEYARARDFLILSDTGPPAYAAAAAAAASGKPPVKPNETRRLVQCDSTCSTAVSCSIGAGRAKQVL
jgi:hypothetical protein